MGTEEQPNLAQKLLWLSPWGNSTAPFPCGPSLLQPSPQLLLLAGPVSPSSIKTARDTPPAVPQLNHVLSCMDAPHFNPEPSCLTTEVLDLPVLLPLKTLPWLPNTKIERPRVHLLISPTPPGTPALPDPGLAGPSSQVSKCCLFLAIFVTN